MRCNGVSPRGRTLRGAHRITLAESGAIICRCCCSAHSLGLGVLAKGPAAIILAGGAVAIWALATKSWRAAFRVAHPIAIAAFCVIALPWYALCAARNPDFLRVFLWQHNVERYATPMFQHRQPFWYFAPVALLALLPWTVLLWPTWREGLRLQREKSWAGSPGFFFACWAVCPIVFFSFSQSKLPGYILPAIPPLALLLRAIALHRAISDNRNANPSIAAGNRGYVAGHLRRRRLFRCSRDEA